DVSGDGRITAADALLILYYRVGLISAFPVARACASDWAFIPEPGAALHQQIVAPAIGASSCQPGAIDWQPLAASVTDQDFSAVLFGDCSGNWRPGTGSSVPARVPGTQGSGAVHGTVRVGGARASRTGALRVPVYAQASAPFRALDLQLSFD